VAVQTLFYNRTPQLSNTYHLQQSKKLLLHDKLANFYINFSISLSNVRQIQVKKTPLENQRGAMGFNAQGESKCLAATAKRSV
jgi:hypothetical protein